MDMDFELDGLFFDDPEPITPKDTSTGQQDATGFKETATKSASSNSDDTGSYVEDEIIFGPSTTPKDASKDKQDDQGIVFEDDSDDEPDSKGKDGVSDSETIELNKSYFEFLKKNNLLFVKEDFEFDGSSEKLAEAQDQTLETYKDSAFKAIMNALPEKIQNLVNYSLEGGTNYEPFLKENTGFDISTDEGKEAAIRYFYKNTANWDDKRIDKHLSRLDDDDLAEEATEALLEIEEYNKVQQAELVKAQQLAKQELEEKQKAFQANIRSVIDKVGYIENTRKNSIKNFMFNTIRKSDGILTDYQRTLQNIQSNPEHLAQLADLLMDYDKEKGISYNRFERKAKTTLTRDLKTHLDQTVADKVPSLVPGKNSKDDIDWKAFLRRAQ